MQLAIPFGNALRGDPSTAGQRRHEGTVSGHARHVVDNDGNVMGSDRDLRLPHRQGEDREQRDGEDQREKEEGFVPPQPQQFVSNILELHDTLPSL